MSQDCPCGSGQLLSECCAPAIDGTRPAPTAEALMRSRYTAFVLEEIDYLGASLDTRMRKDFDAASVREWLGDVEFTGLEILRTQAGQPGDSKGVVEFRAKFVKAGEDSEIHEQSRFKQKGGRWYYVDGVHKQDMQEPERKGPKVGRNDPCPCGSGKKYKKCCA